jgi:hypothetical protein
VEQDAKAAVSWLRKAADQRLPQAQYLLAAVLSRGLYGEERDPAAGAVWLRRAAEQDHADAQYELGVAYAEGRGVEKNPTEAMLWISKAAQNGQPKALDAVAAMPELRRRLGLEAKPR